MAVFKAAADADLPLLSKIYAVDPDRDDELLFLLEPWPAEHGHLWGYLNLVNPEGRARAEAEAKKNGETSYRMFLRDLEEMKESEAFFQEHREACRLAHSVMDSLFYEEGARRGDLWKIEEGLSRFRRLFTYSSDPEEKTTDFFQRLPWHPETLVPLRNLTPEITVLHKSDMASVPDVGDLITHGFLYEVYRQVDSLIENVKAGRNPLAECSRCRNVHIARKGQRYCSHKCGDMASKAKIARKA